MKFRKIIPSPAIRPFVKHYWSLTVGIEDIPYQQQFFPFGSFELIFNLHNAPEMKIEGDKIMQAQPESLFPGQFTQQFILSYSQAFTSVGISLQPWAGNLLFGIPAQHFTNRITALADIRRDEQLAEQLSLCCKEEEIYQVFEGYLIQKLRKYQADPIASGIAQAIMIDPSATSFKDILALTALSRRRIEQRFLAATGLPMGLFARKLRMQKAVHILRKQPHLSLTEAGLTAGYYDQAHFIRDFRSFSGLSPKAFLKQQQAMNNNVSALMMD